ncbi:MAG: hypothetical protein LBL73_11150 [Synergistaceae bacterium]|jgi:hypothetical protein|nr:hypothetical protein [Synergistaceae bacterium]
MSEYKKCALTIAIFMLSTLMAFASPGTAQAALTLGSPDGWQCGGLKTVRLDAVSGNQGFWLERDYRTGDGVSLKAILMGGKGPVMLNVPAPQTESSDGLLGAGRTYRTLTAGGFPALLERDQFLGLSLAVIIPGAVLTVETPPGPADEEITDIALVLLSLM